jgi:DNA-binding ferritin-like protein (Dps family)
MTAAWIGQITGSFDDKKRWRQYKARKQQLPASYRTAIDGLERYLTYAGAVSKGDVLVQMFEDLADLIERAAADGTPIREIVGDEPVEFAESFLENYADGQWINKERARLIDSIDRAAADGAPRADV